MLAPLSPLLSPAQHSAKKALEHLASIDLIELCNEAKVECCRATRDLRSCGRHVESVLNSCGHASLCTECCQRCDICPICRIPIPKNGNRLRLRLYYECIEAGLISKKCDDRFQEKEGGKQIAVDIERLYSLFDVAMDNNLVSLICHYVTDVCMDESAVSSDPVIAFLLDEVVVKDWCRRTFKNILTELQDLYNNTVQQMKAKLSLLLKFSVTIVGISIVLEVLESSFQGNLSAQLYDMHLFQESILKTKQHMEIMMWLIRHNFLENIDSCYANLAAWNSSVLERKSAAFKRAWPESVNHTADSTKTNGCTLFIEDALSNIEIEPGYTNEMGGEFEIASLHKDGSSLFVRSKIEGITGCYPFENLRAAADVLFLRGSSYLVVAKQAIFLYYLFDRHWTRPEEEWRCVIDDFAATFNISRHSLLESFCFYLLDHCSDDALQEACRLLPEISGPTTHPKIAQVLLERQNPDAALMVLRWCGRDGGQSVSLEEAVTAVRVRVECGLLTEAFMYQRTLCMKIKEKMLKSVPSQQCSNNLIDEFRTWPDWVEALVTEICLLCIRRNMVERIIEFPWNPVEEKYLHKSLLDFAVDDPSTTIGSLLVVFYLQRYRYVEAYQVDRELQCVERNFISNNVIGEEVLFKMKSASQWRAGLVEKGLDLLPEFQQQEAKTGKFLETVVPPPPPVNEPTSLLVPTSVDSSFFLSKKEPMTSSKPDEFTTDSHFELGNHGSRSITNLERMTMPQNGVNKKFKFDDIMTPGICHVKATPLKEFNKMVPQNSRFILHHLDEEISPQKEDNVFLGRPHSIGVKADPITLSSSSSSHLLKESARDNYLNALGKPHTPWNVVSSDDPMDLSWSNGEKAFNVGPRWRSDDEEIESTDRVGRPAYYYSKPVRRCRLSKRSWCPGHQ